MLNKYFSYDQLARAWQQITSGQNLNYKYYFKHIYQGYEHSLDENLKTLSSRLLSGGFQSNQVLRFFIPKSITSQRPITLLPVEDQIAYHAIAAKVADEICARRRPLEYKVVFSNILAEDRSVFLFENWHYCYGRYQDETEARVLAGSRWVVTCDLASFYDTISHEILFQNIPSLKKDAQARDYLSDILSSWTFEKKYEARRHGLPQGPISSDLLAEAFLLLMDEKIAGEISYIRYVDDIRIFAKSKEEAQHSALKLERFLRSIGLVPQPEKFSIKKLKSGKELHKIEGSQAYDFVEDPDESAPRLSENEAEGILTEALLDVANGGKPNATLTRFALFRGKPNIRTTKIALGLAEEYPQFVEPAFVFLRRNRNRTSTIQLAESLLTTSPFGFVRLKCWELFYWTYSELPTKSRKMLATAAIEIIKTQDSQEPTNLLGAVQYLFKHARQSRNRQAIFGFNLSNRFIMALALKRLEWTLAGIGKKAFERLHSDLPDVGLASLHLYEQIGPLLIASLNKNKRKDSAYVNSLHRLSGHGLPVGESDSLRVGLQELLGISTDIDTRKLLGIRKWRLAHTYVVRANVYKKRAPGTWLRSVNGISELFVWSLASEHNKRNKDNKKKISLKQKDGKFTKYGALLSKSNRLAIFYPGVLDELRDVHDKKNGDAESHALNEKTGRRSKAVIQTAELAKLKKKAAAGLGKVIGKIKELENL